MTLPEIESPAQYRVAEKKEQSQDETRAKQLLATYMAQGREKLGD